MTAVLLLAFAGMVVGCFLSIGLSPMEFTESIFSRILAKPNSIKSQINEATRRKKPNFLRREIMEAQEVLRLTPIVNKLSDMRVVNADLEYLITEPRKEFITMAFLVIGNIPLLYMLNKDWYNSLMNTIPGQVILAVSAVGIFVATAIVIKLTKPIEFKR